MPPPDSNGRHILIVEDHEDSAGALARLLKSQGYQVSIATTLADARRACASTDFAALLCDILLPDGSGLVLPDFVRGSRCVPKMIAVTASGMPHDVEAAKSAGFDEIVIKPFDLKEILQFL
jgi:two-component system OmpR family response regulator